MAYRVSLISLGCPKNQIDAEHMLAKLDDAGMQIVDYFDGCDAVIINTCGFIDDAKKEAIETIFDVVELKNEGTVGAVIVTGCLSQRYKEELLNEIPEIDSILGIGADEHIADAVIATINGKSISDFPDCELLPMEGKRLLTTPEYWAYIKIAEGCSNCCTYCTIPSIRGKMRSRKIEDIVAEAKTLAASGVKELILVAQDTTAYGIDIYSHLMLPQLLKELCKIDGIVWIRMLYCYPDKITDELIDTMASEEKVANYIDLPLQHINDNILSKMNRRGSKADIISVITKLRARIPDVILRTTFIVGFPGETEDDFGELLDFIKETRFDRLGCFLFSPQENTPAAKMTQTVSQDIKVRREEIIMGEQFKIMQEKNEEKIGNVYNVLVESYDAYTDSYTGRTYMDAPDIDAQVIFTGKGDYNDGDFAEVEIIDANEYDLIGRA